MSAIDLRLGDCMNPIDGLPALGDGAVDTILADPPYDWRTHRACLEGEKRAHGRRVDAPLPFPPLEGEALEAVAGELARVAKGWIVLFCAERQVEAWARALEAAGGRWIRLGFALRTNPKPQLSGDRPSTPADLIAICHAGRVPLAWAGGGRAASWPAPPSHRDPGGQSHPTQKPLHLMRALVEDFAPAGGLVLDPFAGAGTTAVACKLAGRSFLGWERDPSYHAAALRRLADTREAPQLPGLDARREQLTLAGAGR